MGWYYYLEGQFRFPFTATCIAQRAVSALRVKDEVEVIGMPPEEECACEVFVTIRWDRPEDHQTWQAVKDSELCLYYWLPEYWLVRLR